MAQLLHSLTLDEISLVDRPANSEMVDGKKIPRAVVAIWKRDGDIPLEDEVAKAAAGVKFVIGFPSSGEGGSKVQSVIFEKDKWSLKDAKAWLKDHHFTGREVDETGDSFRFRQEAPEGFSRFRTIAPGTAQKAGSVTNQDPRVLQLQGEDYMNLEQIEKRLNDQEAVLNSLTVERDILKAENVLVLKMSTNERELYASMDEDTRKAYVGGDVGKRGTLMETAKAQKTEKDLVDKMDAVTKAKYQAAGPAERAEILKAMTAKQKEFFGKPKDGEDKGKGDVEKAKPFAGEETDEEEAMEEGETEKKAKPVAKRDLELVHKLAATEDRVAKAESELAVIRKRERLMRFTKRAEDELPHTPGTPEEKGARLQKMADVYGEDSEDFNALLTTMKAADRTLALSFGEVGKAGGTIPAERAWDAAVEKISKRDSISIAKATGKAMEEVPELYLDYERSHRQYAVQQ